MLNPVKTIPWKLWSNDMPCSECVRLSSLYNRLEAEYENAKGALKHWQLSRLASEMEKQNRLQREEQVMNKGQELQRVRRQFDDHLRKRHANTDRG